MKTKIARILSAGVIVGGVSMATGNILAQEASTNLISLTTFDAEAAAPWSYGYFYGNNGLGFYENSRAYYLPDDLEMTNALYQFAFDITDLNGTLGYGTGTGAPFFLTDPAGFITAERANYIITFDARVEGLEEGVTEANAEMQVQFFIPND
ncbi:MAG TPA: hypothetical protein VM735_07870, partial [Candidatus Kapabacteria bacterium]|nr:hypothetical protein [Candidatus Kapabacteria bacterium]